MFLAALFTRVRGESTKLPGYRKEVNKMWYIHTVEYNSAIKKKQSPDTLKVSHQVPRKTQTHKATYCIIVGMKYVK